MILVEELTKSYNDEPCLRGVNLRVEKGEFVSVMGESGSGKTTLLEILVGVRSLDSGKVRVCGEDILSMSQKDLAKFRRTKMGVVYQNFGLISTLTAEENIRLPLLLEGVKGGESILRAQEIAKKLKIEGCLEKFPRQLSGGQQQRIAIARACIYRPEVLFLDEPTGSLDSENTQNVLQFLFAMQEQGCTILQITHSERAAKGTRIVRIVDGKVQA